MSNCKRAVHMLFFLLNPPHAVCFRLNKSPVFQGAHFSDASIVAACCVAHVAIIVRLLLVLSFVFLTTSSPFLHSVVLPVCIYMCIVHCTGNRLFLVGAWDANRRKSGQEVAVRMQAIMCRALIDVVCSSTTRMQAARPVRLRRRRSVRRASHRHVRAFRGERVNA